MAMTVRLGCSSSQMRSRPERVGDRSHVPSCMCPVVHIKFLLVWQQGGGDLKAWLLYLSWLRCSAYRGGPPEGWALGSP